MNFSKADKVLSVIDNMQQAENLRAPQRALLNGYFNGDPPWTKQEADDNKQLINFNDKAGQNLLHQARGQYENAFLKPGNFFKVQIDCPADKQAEWNQIVTTKLNKTLKRSKAFLHVMRSKFAGVVLHGVGAQVWWDDQKWLPSSIGIQDMLIPTDTEITMENCRYISFRRKMRPGTLFKMTLGKGNDLVKGWNMPMVKKILDQYKDLNQNPHNYDWSNNPEQMTELFKQNLSYYDSDSAPVIWMQDFWFKEEGENNTKPGWYRRLLLDKGNTGINVDDLKGDGNYQFIFEPPEPEATAMDQFVHFQLGDGNNVPPFMIHSIRSLAYMVYELLWTMNRLGCQLTQHVFEQLIAWFSVQNPSDRGYLDHVLLKPPFAVIPEGLKMITANERYKVDPQLIAMIEGRYQQKINDASASYMQNAPDSGDKGNRTAFEVGAIMAKINALMSSMLTLAYNQEYFAYLEIARRFTIEHSHDFEVKKFRSDCIAAGVSAKYLDFERWEIIPEQVLGAGNKMLELAQARELRSVRQTLNPVAQQEVDRIYITALTDNAALADTLVPRAQPVSDAVHDAELAFGTLMQGVQMNVKEGLNHVEQVATLLRLANESIQQLTATGGMASPRDIAGLRNVIVYAAKQVGIIAQNPDNKALVKQFGDEIGKLNNMIKAFDQRAREAAQANGQPGANGEAQAQMAQEQQKLQFRQQQHVQKIQQKQQSFEQDQQRRNLSTVADIRRNNAKAIAEAHVNGVREASRFTPFSE